MLKEFKPEIEALLEYKTKPIAETIAKPVVVTPKGKVTSSDEEILRQFCRLQLDCLAHRYLYYVREKAITSDAEYDRIENRLKTLRQDHPLLWEKSEYRKYCPTETIGSELEESYPDAAIWLADQKVKEYEDLRKYFAE